MHDVAMMAATEWAKQYSAAYSDPVEFGANVALVFQACREAGRPGITPEARSAALAALSVPCEVWQALALLSSHSPSRKAQCSSRKDQAGAV